MYKIGDYVILKSNTNPRSYPELNGRGVLRVFSVKQGNIAVEDSDSRLYPRGRFYNGEYDNHYVWPIDFEPAKKPLLRQYLHGNS